MSIETCKKCKGAGKGRDKKVCAACQGSGKVKVMLDDKGSKTITPAVK